MYNSINFSSEKSIMIGIKYTGLVNLSSITQITTSFSDIKGKLNSKSIATYFHSHSAIITGYNKPDRT